MKVCYFTATGNSLYVAKRIGGELLSIPRLMKQDSIEITDDAVGIVCPVYGGEMPKMVRRFLARAAIRTDYFFFVSTYGMSDSVAKPNAIAAAEKAGLKVSYVASLKMVDNYLPGFEMQNQMDTVGEKKIEEHLNRICADITARRIDAPAVGLGQRIAMALIHGTMGKVVLKDAGAQSYFVNGDCIRCGICAKVCPADNIAVTDKVLFLDRCEDCYACLHNCPKNAIHMKNERSAVRFRNENIALQEIIAANE